MDIPAGWFVPSRRTASSPRASDLVVSQLASDLEREVMALTRRPGFERHYWLQTQLRRSAAAASSTIAEGFTCSDAHEFARFVRRARTLIDDTRNQIAQVKTLGLIPAGEADRLRLLADRASAAATSLLRYLQAS